MPAATMVRWSSRARQRREHGKFEDVERQFALDDLDVAQDRLLRVVGKSEYVAAIADDPDLPPRLQHRPVIGDMVLLLLGRGEVDGVDVLEPDEHALTPAAAAFSMKPGILWQAVSTWMMKRTLDPL